MFVLGHGLFRIVPCTCTRHHLGHLEGDGGQGRMSTCTNCYMRQMMYYINIFVDIFNTHYIDATHRYYAYVDLQKLLYASDDVLY